jgi:hypothetical protein
VALLAGTIGCSGGQEVTPEAVDQAKRFWTQANIKDYDLDYTVRGRIPAHYLVTVRDGEVRKIESVGPDGRHELPSPQPRYFGVEGQFLTIKEDLVLARRDEPFGQPKGTKVVMRFQPDPKLGYPRWYRRDVLGTPLSIAIEVNALTPARTAVK